MADQKATEFLCIYDPVFADGAKGFLEEFGLNAAIEPINSTDDLLNVGQKYALVRYLEIFLHGTPGMLCVPSGGAMTGTYFGSLINSANMLCKDARVLFLGCNVAAGSTGDKFLADVGKNTLKGVGGTVGASTVVNNVWRGSVYLKVISLWEVPFDNARLKVRRFDINGDLIGSRDVDRWGKVH